MFNMDIIKFLIALLINIKQIVACNGADLSRSNIVYEIYFLKVTNEDLKYILKQTTNIYKPSKQESEAITTFLRNYLSKNFEKHKHLIHFHLSKKCMTFLNSIKPFNGNFYEILTFLDHDKVKGEEFQTSDSSKKQANTKKNDCENSQFARHGQGLMYDFVNEHEQKNISNLNVYLYKIHVNFDQIQKINEFCDAIAVIRISKDHMYEVSDVKCEGFNPNGFICTKLKQDTPINSSDKNNTFSKNIEKPQQPQQSDNSGNNSKGTNGISESGKEANQNTEDSTFFEVTVVFCFILMIIAVVGLTGYIIYSIWYAVEE